MYTLKIRYKVHKMLQRPLLNAIAKQHILQMGTIGYIHLGTVIIQCGRTMLHISP